jgi:S1-C subfamily serine protease
MSAIRIPGAATIAFLAIAALAGSAARAQDTSAAGRFGAIALASNFRPDPYTVSITAGGTDAASALDVNCTGFIGNRQPDYVLSYSDPGNFDLGFFIVSAVDTTLVISDPSGNWHCNDDFNDHGGTNAGLVFPSPDAGTYGIWAGTYDEDDFGAAAQLVISEIGAPWDARYGAAELTANFSPDPFVTDIVAGGNDDASTLANGCSGFVSAERPDYDLVYQEAGRFTLSMFAQGDIDSTLAVHAPDGNWYCSDDFAGGGHNPGVLFDNPIDGTYHVWVGAYEQTETGQTVSLYITETGTPPWHSSSAGEGDATSPSNRLSSSGTGFLVSRAGHVLTNHHVVDGCARMTFQIRGELAVEANLLASNATVDLALLKTDASTHSPAPFRGGSSLRLGDELVVYGFPLLGDLSSQGNLTNGIVSALSGLNDDLSRLQMTAQIQPGNSGGPVLDRAGNVVGVVVETANTEFFQRQRNTLPQNVNFAVRDSMARSFLDTNNVNYAISTNHTISSVADIAEQAQQYTGLILCYE